MLYLSAANNLTTSNATPPTLPPKNTTLNQNLNDNSEINIKKLYYQNLAIRLTHPLNNLSDIPKSDLNQVIYKWQAAIFNSHLLNNKLLHTQKNLFNIASAINKKTAIILKDKKVLNKWRQTLSEEKTNKILIDNFLQYIDKRSQLEKHIPNFLNYITLTNTIFPKRDRFKNLLVLEKFHLKYKQKTTASDKLKFLQNLSKQEKQLLKNLLPLSKHKRAINHIKYCKNDIMAIDTNIKICKILTKNEVTQNILLANQYHSKLAIKSDILLLKFNLIDLKENIAPSIKHIKSNLTNNLTTELTEKLELNIKKLKATKIENQISNLENITRLLQEKRFQPILRRKDLKIQSDNIFYLVKKIKACILCVTIIPVIITCGIYFFKPKINGHRYKNLDAIWSGIKNCKFSAHTVSKDCTLSTRNILSKIKQENTNIQQKKY